MGRMDRGSVYRATLLNRMGWGAMRDEFYRVVYWVGMAALAVWTVYSAYFALSFS